jgi:hypothetical protein
MKRVVLCRKCRAAADGHTPVSLEQTLTGGQTRSKVQTGGSIIAARGFGRTSTSHA